MTKYVWAGPTNVQVTSTGKKVQFGYIQPKPTKIYKEHGAKARERRDKHLAKRKE